MLRSGPGRCRKSRRLGGGEEQTSRMRLEQTPRRVWGERASSGWLTVSAAVTDDRRSAYLPGPGGARGRRRGARRPGAARPDRDGRGGRPGDEPGRAPARPGRHRHRQVAGLPRAGAAAPPPGRGRHRHPGPAAPAGRARHPGAASRPTQATCSAARSPDVRRAQGPLQLRLPAPGPRRGARRPGRPGRHPEGSRAPRCSSCGSGPRSRPSPRGPATATPHPSTPTRSGGRSR